MWRKMLLFFGVLVLVLASVSSVYADPKPKEDKDNPGKGQAQREVTPAGAGDVFKGKSFQAKLLNVDDDDAWQVESKYGNLTVDVSDADIKWPGRKNATPASFSVNDMVVIQLVNKANGATTGLLARKVHLMPGGMFIHFTGELTAVNDSGDRNGNRITVKNGAGDDMTFALDDDVAGTSVKQGPETWLLKDFKMNGTAPLGLNNYVGKKVTVVARDNTDPKFATAIVLHGNGNGDDDDDDGDDD